jgi:prepilin peptidase CpaA
MGVSLSYGLLGGLAIALLVAAVTDTRRRQIDNGLNLAIALCAPLFWWAQGLGLVDIGWQLGVAVGAFAVLTGLFAVGAMGGGDVKLLTALALWIKPLWFAHLLIVMALAGGILTVVLAFGTSPAASARSWPSLTASPSPLPGCGSWPPTTCPSSARAGRQDEQASDSILTIFAHQRGLRSDLCVRG